MRLAKYLAHGGVASRRAAEKLIADGRVTIAGVVVTDPARDVDDSSEVAVDGAAVAPEAHETWMLNKPLDVVSTASEPGRRRAVTDLVTTDARLYPVGRLDADSTGLILLTNDGALANALTHPRFEVPKAYRAQLRSRISDREIERLRTGVELEDGPTAPADVRRLGDDRIQLIIHEGRNRQVRRMLERVGNRVTSLKRVGFGPLSLGDLASGRARRLTESEVDRLWEDSRAVRPTSESDER